MFQATAFVHGIPLPIPTCTSVAFSHPMIYIALVSVSAFYRAINYTARCTFHTHRHEMQHSICKMTSFIMVCSFKNSIASSLVRHALRSVSFSYFFLQRNVFLNYVKYFFAESYHQSFSFVFVIHGRLQSEIQGRAKF